jgi:hypothetical protein
LLLHISVVDRPIPGEEGGGTDEYEVSYTSTKIVPTIGRSCEKNKETGDKIDDESAQKHKPQVIQARY